MLAERAGVGYEAPDPIFIVGLPRSGSTLVEQILASHSQVEGTSELPILGRIAESIGRYRTDGVRYPEAVPDLRDKDLRAYGKQYIEESRRHRTTDKPLFTDKLPNNFPMLGFAQLILPNAKFINARRHPFDSCLGAYKQLFGQGQNFTYDMLDLAHYYQQYDAIMKHWHKVMPGRVLDVHYEETVTDLEGQVRRHPRSLRPAVRGSVPAILRDRTCRENGKFGAGATADLYQCAGQVAALRSSISISGAISSAISWTNCLPCRETPVSRPCAEQSVERPLLQSVDGIAHVHAQVHRPEYLVRGEVI